MKSVPASPEIAVVGGGITGLTAAWQLVREGRRVRLFEAGDRLGGAIRTERIGGWLIEGGPASIQDQAPEVRALVEALGLQDQRVEASPAAVHRYLVRDGSLVPVPTSPKALLRSPLLSAAGKVRLLWDLTARPRERPTDLSFADFMAEHFGPELVAAAVQPVVGGIYAGDPNRLSTRYGFPKLWAMDAEQGSLLRAQVRSAKARRARGEPVLPPIFSFREGLQSLTDALAARGGAVTLRAEVTSVEGPSPAGWELSWQTPGGTHQGRFAAVVLALPAWALARLDIGSPGRRPLDPLREISYPPVTSVFLGFRRDAVAHPLDGFGVLVPLAERRHVMGVLFSSTLFPGRAPDGHVAVTALVGGGLQSEHAGLNPTEQLVAVLADLRDLLGVSGAAVIVRQTRWPRAIPQYELGFAHMLACVAACERDHPGLWIGGSARDGISLPQCIKAGLALAEKASRALDSPGR